MDHIKKDHICFVITINIGKRQPYRMMFIFTTGIFLQIQLQLQPLSFIKKITTVKFHKFNNYSRILQSIKIACCIRLLFQVKGNYELPLSFLVSWNIYIYYFENGVNLTLTNIFSVQSLFLFLSSHKIYYQLNYLFI